MSFGKLIQKEKIILNDSKNYNSGKIHLVCYETIKYIESILNNIPKNVLQLKKIKKHIENLSISLHEILKNSIDGLNDIKGLLNLLKIKKIELKVYQINNNIIIIIKDNGAGIKANGTKNKKNNINYLGGQGIGENRIKNFSNTIKYKRISKKSGTVVLLKMEI